jgi:phosphoenolpyruvate carboxykinase (GTP)
MSLNVLDKTNLDKLKALKNENVINIAKYYIELMKPSKLYVFTDTKEDTDFVKRMAVEKKEETSLKMQGHTIHFDHYNDQGRDKVNTRILVNKDQKMSKTVDVKDREEGLKEILGLMDGILKGKDMIIRFFTLGPKNSIFSISAMQITDSWYVAHSEDLLYRQGYEQFKKLKGSNDFFLVVHSAGELENNVTKNIDKRRIFVDLAGNRVLSINNQYAGNSLGLKKLSLRLAIYKSNNEDWLTEHMFVMGLHSINKNRVTFAAGAYPSMCGKTSTAMVPGQTIIGDDIAYLKIVKGICYAANIECGIFGIIKDVNAKDDPLIYDALRTPREIIFSNILVKDNMPYWQGMGVETPKEGTNHSGPGWVEGKKDAKGNVIPLCHANARFTLNLSELKNADLKSLEDPKGVPIKGIFYGGRDSDTSVPVFESLDWEHGIFVGAIIESETTQATLGKEGVRESSPMANMDFMVVPLAKYFDNHKKFGQTLAKNAPKVFATNYFLKANGKFTNEKTDKKVWLLWAEGRMNGEYETIKTPFGLIPKHSDLKALFKAIFNKDYTEKEYIDQFSVRLDKQLEKLDRMEAMFKSEEVSKFLFDILYQQRKDFQAMKQKYGKSVISPLEL